MAGKTIKLFLTDGKPNGLTVAELQQWTGISLACPRSEVQKLTQRPEATKPGVYILTGQDEESQLPVAYIGEAENIGERLKQHHRTLDFWNRICFFTQKDDNLTKGHIRYLEARMIQVAKEAKRMSLTNGSSPSPSNIPLPESDLADMEYFLQQMQMVLPVLGINLLQPQPVITPEDSSESTQESPLFEFKARDANATAKLVDGEFVVLGGSLARKESTASIQAYMVRIRQELVATGVLEEITGGQYRFTENYAFGSPSTASGVIAGRPSNGRREWKVKNTGQTYGEWDEARLAE